MATTPVNRWILEPVASARLFVGEETKIAGLLQRALTHIEMGRPLLDLAADRFRAADHEAGVRGVRKLIDESSFRTPIAFSNPWLPVRFTI